MNPEDHLDCRDSWASSDESPSRGVGHLTHHYCVPYSVRHTLMGSEAFDALRLELRRGCLVMAVLAELRAEHYGYTLKKHLADRGLDIDEGTLYPLLRRLESQGLLKSEWREEDKRNKRFYRLSAEGRNVLKELLVEWQQINTAMNRVLAGSRSVA
jgi:PadR family transcriptional regulator, regulatory protein PadR